MLAPARGELWLEERWLDQCEAAPGERMAMRGEQHCPGTTALAGAELVVGRGWLGLRSHPRPSTSIVFGGPELPPWFDAVLEEER